MDRLDVADRCSLCNPCRHMVNSNRLCSPNAESKKTINKLPIVSLFRIICFFTLISIGYFHYLLPIHYSLSTSTSETIKSRLSGATSDLNNSTQIHSTSLDYTQSTINVLATSISPAPAIDEQYAHFRLNNSADPPFAIFYNVYLTFKRSGYLSGMRIINEQLQQISESYAGSLPNRPVTIYYNTIGRKPNIDKDGDDDITKLCQKYANALRCRHLQHFESASEAVTLQNTHDFCMVNKEAKVVYLHSKGTYHGNSRNENWRRPLTAAAISKHCLDSSSALNTTCNLCGLQYTPIYASFIVGNMWAADCSYVAKLLPAAVYVNQTHQVMAKACKMQGRGQLRTSLYNIASHHDTHMYLGMDRWALEMWVGSHPLLQPCDVSTKISLPYWQVPQNYSDQDFELRKAPRKPLASEWFLLNLDKLQTVLSSSRLRLQEQFLLAGNIHKWVEFYGQVPPKNSWVWSWFPDGEFWQDAIAKYGMNDVVKIVTQHVAQDTSHNNSSMIDDGIYEACRDLL